MITITSPQSLQVTRWIYNFFVLIRPSFHLIESQSSRTHDLYYYNVAVLNLNSPPLPSFHHNTSEVIVAIDLLCKTTICCSSGVARNDPTAALCWIRLFLRAHNQSVVRTSWKLAEFSRELRSLHTCNLGAVWVLFFPWPELWFDVHMEPAPFVDSNASCCWTISTWPWDTRWGGLFAQGHLRTVHISQT
jgi:hypothetical protein